MNQDSKHDETHLWWIDYLENELESGLESDLQTLLQVSQEDRDSFEHFRLLREWVKDSDPVAEWPLTDRLNRVRHKVMSAIAGEDPYCGVDVTKALSV